MDTVARFGGDEFVVMLSELDVDKGKSTSGSRHRRRKNPRHPGQTLCADIQARGKAETTVEHHCTASIGVALFSKHEASQDDILKWADTAMYQAKEAGGNLIRFFDS